MARFILAALTTMFLSCNNVFSQDKDPYLSKLFCRHATTITFNDSAMSFAGLRINVEPRIGFYGVNDPSNKVEGSLASALGFSLQTTLVGGFLGLEIMVMTAGPLTFTEDSYVRDKGLVKNNQGIVRTNGSFALGLTVLNGVLSLGYMHSTISQGQYFAGATGMPTELNGWYLNVNASTIAQSIGSVLKRD